MSRQVCALFYSDAGACKFTCNKCGCSRTQAPASGYSNLLSHLNAKHPGFMAEYEDFTRSTDTDLSAYGFIDERTSDIYRWMQWIVERNHPLSEVDNPLTRSISRLTPISTKTLKLYMQHVATSVGAAVATELGDTFGVMFDGWTNGPHHYVGVYGVCAVDGQLRQPLLALSPMESGQSADAHIELLTNVLCLYEKTSDKIKFIVSDNCATNQSIAIKLGVPLVGYTSHRFNLAVTKFLAPFRELTDPIHALMVQLRQPNNYAELTLHTDLRPIKANITCWSSTYDDMVERYLVSREAAKRVAAVEDLVPKQSAHKKIKALFSQLTELESVCKTLQAEERSLADVCLLFDSVVEKHLAMGEYLLPTARIIHSPMFESAVVNVINEQPLTASESRSVLSFATEADLAPDRPVGGDDFATSILRQAKKPRRTDSGIVVYKPLLKLIPPTSNHCERLFSQCKLILTSQRQDLLPANFEMLSFLRANRNMWGPSSLAGFSERDI